VIPYLQPTTSGVSLGGLDVKHRQSHAMISPISIDCCSFTSKSLGVVIFLYSFNFLAPIELCIIHQVRPSKQQDQLNRHSKLSSYKILSKYNNKTSIILESSPQCHILLPSATIKQMICIIHDIAFSNQSDSDLALAE
jgi:hypothetical protein